MEVTEIKRIGPWSIQVKPWPVYDEVGPWWDVRVKHQDAKGAYWLGWNGKRLAKNKSLASLSNNPGLTEQVEDTLKQWFRSEET